MAALGFVHVMRGDEHRQTAGGELVDFVPEFAARFRIHARRRLVEQKQLRLVNQAGRQRKPLFPAAGKRAGELLAALHHAKAFQAFFDGGLALRNFVKPRDEIQILLDAQILVEAEPLRHVADALFDLGALCAKIQTEAASLAAVGLEQTAEHPQKSRLAAAVRAEEAVNLAGPHLHGDVVDDGARAEFFRDAAHVNDQIARVHCESFTSTGWPGRRSAASAGENVASTMNTSLARFSRL